MTTDNEKITILDIADRADVSPSTVSRVLRGSATVSGAKEKAVLDAVSELDYQPNIFAQSLASGQSMTIGVLTQNFGSPFYDGILRGILDGLDETSYWPFFVDGRWQPAVEKRALNMLLGRRVDGLIIVGGRTSPETLLEFAQKTPLVVVTRKLEEIPDRCLYVNNFAAAYKATKHLLDQGHRDIAHFTTPRNYAFAVDDIQERREGYSQALADAGVEPDPRLVVEGNLRPQSGVLAVEMLLGRGRPFSAIFSANDQMAFGARLALYRRGIRVPDDVSLVGFDNEESGTYMIPPLTTVKQPALDLGQAAAKAILNLINNKPPVIDVFDAELIIRESVSRYR